MDIHHGMIIRNITPERICEALTRQDDLAVWMGMGGLTLAQPEIGSVIEFHYDQGRRIFKFEVIRLEPPSLVQWRAIQPVWQTENGANAANQIITWTLSTPYEGGTLVDFRMGGWIQDDEAYSSNSYKWASLMFRLKVYLGDIREVADFIPLLTDNRSP